MKIIIMMIIASMGNHDTIQMDTTHYLTNYSSDTVKCVGILEDKGEVEFYDGEDWVTAEHYDTVMALQSNTTK